MTIHDLEISVQAGLEGLRNVDLSLTAPAKEVLLPEGMTPIVELVQHDGDRKNGDDAAWDWNPQSDRIVISFRSASLFQDVPAPKRREPRFQPIAVLGEPVSTTLLRDRGDV